ncbi:hypothetical protein RSOLAG1IB_05989 [Rhizoctonia solani AG-1 IB]|uniref:Uncharacterized protein n=1 Tax=Thanatephorus cucumeris (strain AG1-IB / isolate 7/3/14) TaxID=1108050 RepID=A0A0B7F4C6_THACB|nr:hypothetical protein RSOLAG1IB_05989 [Rhizoctonia solani AG-1 IB]
MRGSELLRVIISERLLLVESPTLRHMLFTMPKFNSSFTVSLVNMILRMSIFQAHVAEVNQSSVKSSQ